MHINVEVVNGVAKVTDGDSGKPLDWVHTINFITDPRGTPVLYLGTFDFSGTFTAGPPEAAVPAAGAPAAPAVGA